MKLQSYTMFPADFDYSTRTENPATIGAYIRLLNHQYIDGSVPVDDKERLLIICGATAKFEELINWEFIYSKFPDGKNEKLEEVRSYHIEKSEKFMNDNQNIAI